MTDKKKSSVRDDIEKALAEEEGPDAIATAEALAAWGLPIVGGVLGRRYGRRAASKAHGERLHNIKEGEMIIDDVGNTRPATKRDIESFERQFRREVNRSGTGGMLTGATLGGAAGLPLAFDANRRVRDKRRK